MKNKFLFISILFIFYNCSVIIPYKDLPEPSGKYIIGTEVFEFEDFSREEWFTEEENDFRKIVVQVWYPAIAQSDSLYPYLDYSDIKIPAISKRIGISEKFIKNVTTVKTNAFYKAQPINKEFPVIIFSHGLGGMRNQNSINIEDLVSNGYIVFSVDHPYDANITVFSDSSTADFRSSLLDDVSEEDFWNVRLPQITTRSKDISFLINQLEFFKDQGFYIGKLSDLNNIGIFGHSFGGGTAVVTSYLDNRIKACINLDGWFEPIPNYIINSGLNIPFCFIGQIQSTWDDALYNENRLYKFHDNSSKSILIEIHDTKHFDYADLPYFNRISRLFKVSGKKGKHLTIDLNETITNYFNFYLKGEENNWIYTLDSNYDLIIKD